MGSSPIKSILLEIIKNNIELSTINGPHENQVNLLIVPLNSISFIQFYNLPLTPLNNGEKLGLIIVKIFLLHENIKKPHCLKYYYIVIF